MTDDFKGRLADTWPMDDEMGSALVRLWCEVLEDPNPVYYDPDFAARSRFGGLIAPPPMLMPLTTRPEWTPAGARRGTKDSLVGSLPDYPLAALLRMKQTYARPLRMGERPLIEFYEAEPTPEVDTERGPGRIVSRLFRFVGADGGEIAAMQMDQLRYRERVQPPQLAPAVWDGPASTSLPAGGSRRWVDVREGDTTAPITLGISLKRCIMWVAATRDFYEVHHDPAFAKAGGDPDLFIGVHLAHGLIGRLGTDWGGPEARLVTMDFRTYGRVYLDDSITVRGRVSRKYTNAAVELIDLDVQTATSLGVTHTATLTVDLPA